MVLSFIPKIQLLLKWLDPLSQKSIGKRMLWKLRKTWSFSGILCVEVDLAGTTNSTHSLFRANQRKIIL